MEISECATFIHQSGVNSTISDIFIKTKSEKQFYIGAKHSPAQCGQFVILPDIKTASFEYSVQNVNKINDYAKMIMGHMNAFFDDFCKAELSGKDIKM